jgi:hypothetical protein
LGEKPGFWVCVSWNCVLLNPRRRKQAALGSFLMEISRAGASAVL